MGNKGRQDLDKKDAPSNTSARTHAHTHTHMRGNSGKRWLGKADAPSQERHHPTQGRQWETNGDKISGRRVHHPTHSYMCGEKAGQWETRRHKTSAKRTRHPSQARTWETIGRGLGKEDTLSNTGIHAGDNGKARPWEGRRDLARRGKTSGRRTNHPTQSDM